MEALRNLRQFTAAAGHEHPYLCTGYCQMHALRGFLFVANEGKTRRHYDEEQLNQVSCLNLVTNAVVLFPNDFLPIDRFASKE